VRKIPVWPIVGVVLFVAIWLAATIYLALALALCVLVLLAVYWLFTELPKQFGIGGGQGDREPEPRRRNPR
jgi:hypothetical protein